MVCVCGFTCFERDQQRAPMQAIIKLQILQDGKGEFLKQANDYWTLKYRYLEQTHPEDRGLCSSKSSVNKDQTRRWHTPNTAVYISILVSEGSNCRKSCSLLRSRYCSACQEIFVLT